MKFLEKLNQALGIEDGEAYRFVHEAATRTQVTGETSASEGRSALGLDTGRIAELQRDSERVAKILANIFVEDVPYAVPEPVAASNPIEPALLGLDPPYARFLQAILARPAWTRHELQDMAEDLELMLDGALEQINEAAFKHYDVPCTEGDDPIDVNHAFREKIEQ